MGKVYTEIPRPTEVIDNAIGVSLSAEFREWLFKQPLVPRWSADKKVEGDSLRVNYALPGRPITKDTFAGSPMESIASIVSERFFNSQAIERMWVIVQNPDQDNPGVHRDFIRKLRGKCKTICWYPVEEWHEEWGGELAIFSDEREIAESYLIKPDRMVIFDGTMLHSARPLSNYAKQKRIVVVFAVSEMY